MHLGDWLHVGPTGRRPSEEEEEEVEAADKSRGAGYGVAVECCIMTQEGSRQINNRHVISFGRLSRELNTNQPA